MSSPLELYQSHLSESDFSADQAQRMAVNKLQDLYERLVVRASLPSQRSFLQKLGLSKSKTAEPEKGLYLWGGVGRGKTFLMDVFYEALPFERKMRVHFHRFMHRVHNDLKTLEGEIDPLQKVADKIASEALVICFDEFFVSDIGDAMILGTLMEYLFSRRVSLVATSNIMPNGLYKNGLQRSRFLPAIALLNQHTEVVNVDGGVDYRLRILESAELYHSPLDAAADTSLKDSFDHLAPEPGVANQDIEVEGRMIRARFIADDVVWFDFAALCDGPRSQNDYIELAREFHAVLISNVPCLTEGRDDSARRFIHLVDEFYDRNVKLVLSAEVPLLELYQGGGLGFEFERTASRLLEMQSHDYLAREHRP